MGKETYIVAIILHHKVLLMRKMNFISLSFTAEF